jgi:hypothetical protein
LVCVAVFGISYRVVLTLAMPVGYDEIYDLSLGLLAMRESPVAFLFSVPIERAAAAAPFWWWLQAVPVGLFGDVSLASLRVVPFLLGVATLAIAYFAARRRFGPRVATMFCGLAACSDVLGFANSRGEFAESLMVPLVIIATCAVALAERGFIRGLAWMGLMLTSVGKAILIIGLSCVAEGAAAALAPRLRQRLMARLAIPMSLAVSLTLFWLIPAQVVHRRHGFDHAAGHYNSVFSLIYDVTFRYTAVKEHVTGSSRDAVQVWLDGRVWPLTVLSAGPILAGAVLSLNRIVAGLRRRRSIEPIPLERNNMSALRGGHATRAHRDGLLTARLSMQAGLLAWTLLGVGILLFRGTAGSRFHLLYLPAAWLLAALNVVPWVRSLAPTSAAILGGAWIALTWAALGWESWTAASFDVPRALALAVPIAALSVFGVLIALRAGLSAARCLAVLGLASAIGLSVWAGPARWAPLAQNDSEPMCRSSSLRRLDKAPVDGATPAERGGNYYTFLAHYFLSTDQFERAEHYARKAVDAGPRDATNWMYLGLVYDALGRPADERRQVWRKALDFKPDSELLRARLEAVGDRK